MQIADSLTVAGNLTVNGTLTSLDTTNLDIEDNLFQLNAGLTGSPVNDSGMLINRGDQDNGIFMWDESVDKFTLGLTTADGTATGNITLNSLGTLVANIEGSVTGDVVSQQTTSTSFTGDDLIAVYDVSASAIKKGTITDVALQGQKGQKGEIGATGTTGTKGQKGEIGAKGQKGEIGATGSTGSTGATGAKVKKVK